MATGGLISGNKFRLMDGFLEVGGVMTGTVELLPVVGSE